jgi:hypothetical protein
LPLDPVSEKYFNPANTFLFYSALSIDFPFYPESLKNTGECVGGIRITLEICDLPVLTGTKPGFNPYNIRVNKTRIR